MKKKRRVCIIGAGAAGLSAAWSLSRNDEFETEVWERFSFVGGVSTTHELESNDGEEPLWFNDQVQGGCPTYLNMLNLFKEFNFEPSPLYMRISFGTGPTLWNNYADSDIIKSLQKEVERFGRVLKWVNRLEPIFIFIPINQVLKWAGFSDNFRTEVVFPMASLFFGTGIQTPRVSAAIIARVFLDPVHKLFDYDPKRFLSQSPKMYAFQRLDTLYGTIASKINAKIYNNRTVTKVIRKNGHVEIYDNNGKKSIFDKVIFACSGETALKLLDKPSFMERFVLGNLEYFDDPIVTHEDYDYMKKYYDINLEQKDHYFVRSNPANRDECEMSFNLSMYQPQLKDCGRDIFQTIFEIDEIAKDKIISKRITRQQAHSWKHFAFTVPLMRFIQGKQNSFYCGGWTLVNTHEVAVVSGLAAAERLGAPYPFADDNEAAKEFDFYLKLGHGAKRNT